MSRNYKFHNPKGLYFVSFATVYWLDIFVREEYFTIITESITHCRKHKGMLLYAYCIMPSHIHLIFQSVKESPAELLRDFKGYTSRKLIKAIEENPQESRKGWFLFMMERAAKKNATVSNRQFWQQHNQPVELWTPEVIKQKIDYIHENPVKAGFVVNAVDYKYSSARNYEGGHVIIEIDEDLNSILFTK